jgi:hypothetical protein
MTVRKTQAQRITARLDELSYPGNMGAMEVVQYYKVATPAQEKEMDKIIDAEDWDAFKALIKRVLKVSLA